MKTLIFNILILMSLTLYAQENSMQKFQNDILQPELSAFQSRIKRNNGEVRFAAKIDSAWFASHYKYFVEAEGNIFPESPSRRKLIGDSIVLSQVERKKIIAHYMNVSNLDVGVNPNYAFVSEKETITFLQENKGNIVVHISKPVFIREGNVAVAFYSVFCCGGIYGPVRFAFYKKDKGIWTKWISVTEGAF